MRNYLILLFAISLLSCQNKTKDKSENENQNKEQPESVEVNVNYNVDELANNFKFTEGPAVDQEGNVYFTDIPEAQIWI